MPRLEFKTKQMHKSSVYVDARVVELVDTPVLEAGA